ncbi:hypothetical protein HPB49_020929 [Dermacentor silvarum]|uniref:Uncharacterized protein n=1 Tax=Dermacentor silvarum TaxID=543639 RepID=A0ACB8CSZ8_DERSI|nr:hypothetical protein HPB49_020929 [Dermacentor silvarum]
MSMDGSEAWPAPSFGSEEAPAAGDGDSQGSNENATSSASGAGTFLQPHVPKLSLTATSSAVSATASLPEKPPDVDGRPATTADGVAVFEEDTRSSWNLEPPSSGATTPSGPTVPKDAEDEEAALEEREPSSSCAGGGGGDVPCTKSATASDSSGGENRERTPVVSFAPTVVDCDSQNSGSSVKSGAGGRKRFSDDEVTSEASTTITADKLFEYHWPQDCGDAYMLQEQVRAGVGFGAASGRLGVQFRRSYRTSPPGR